MPLTPIITTEACAFVANSGDGTLSVLSTTLRSVRATVAIGGEPSALVASADGRRVYAADAAGGAVDVIDAIAKQAVGSVAVGPAPRALALGVDRAALIVANSGGDSIVSVDTDTLTASTPVPLMPTPLAIAVDRHADVYVGSDAAAAVVVTDADLQPIASIAMAASVEALAARPGGALLYAAETAAGQIGVIDAATHLRIDGISVGEEPAAIAWRHDGQRAYVALRGANEVAVIDSERRAVRARIAVGAAPAGLALTSDDALLVVANSGDGTVSLVSTAAERVSGTVTVGAAPVAVAIVAVRGGCAPQAIPTPTATGAAPTATPRRDQEDDGCAVSGARDPGVVLLLPLAGLLLVRRRR